MPAYASLELVLRFPDGKAMRIEAQKVMGELELADPGIRGGIEALADAMFTVPGWETPELKLDSKLLRSEDGSAVPGARIACTVSRIPAVDAAWAEKYVPVQYWRCLRCQNTVSDRESHERERHPSADGPANRCPDPLKHIEVRGG